MSVICRVNPDIIIDGVHVACLWPNTQWFEPKSAYSHVDQSEQDAMFLAAYRDRFPKLADWTLEDFRNPCKPTPKP